MKILELCQFYKELVYFEIKRLILFFKWYKKKVFLNLMSWHFVPKILEAILMDIWLALNPPFIDYYELCNILLRYITTAPYVIIYDPHNYFFPK